MISDHASWRRLASGCEGVKVERLRRAKCAPFYLITLLGPSAVGTPAAQFCPLCSNRHPTQALGFPRRVGVAVFTKQHGCLEI